MSLIHRRTFFVEGLGEDAFSHQLLVDLGVDGLRESIVILIVLDGFRHFMSLSLRVNIVVFTVDAVDLFLLLVLNHDSVTHVHWAGSWVVHEIISLIILLNVLNLVHYKGFVSALSFLSISDH